MENNEIEGNMGYDFAIKISFSCRKTKKIPNYFKSEQARHESISYQSI